MRRVKCPTKSAHNKQSLDGVWNINALRAVELYVGFKLETCDGQTEQEAAQR
jgi:hypothetical protein